MAINENTGKKAKLLNKIISQQASVPGTPIEKEESNTKTSHIDPNESVSAQKEAPMEQSKSAVSEQSSSQAETKKADRVEQGAAKAANSARKNIDPSLGKGLLAENFNDGMAPVKSAIEYRRYQMRVLRALKEKRGIQMKHFVLDAIDEKLKRDFPEVLAEAKKLYNIKDSIL